MMRRLPVRNESKNGGRRRRNSALALAAAVSLGAATAAAPAGETWLAAGSGEQAEVQPAAADNVAVTIKADDPTTAGAVSPEKSLPRGADAVVVRATVANAPLRGVTFAVQNSATGQTVGYWQNPVPAEAETPIAAALPLSEKTAKARLFVGTHGQASHATIRDVTWTPVKVGAAGRGSIWAAIVDSKRQASQTFVASNGHLAGIKIRLRHFQADQGEPADLHVSVYEWHDDITATRKGKPIAEAVLPAAQIPHAEEHYERDVTIALDAPTRAGQRYLVSFSTTAGQGMALWAGPSTYDDGYRFENDRPYEDWDLYFETYYAE
jgi:hypothetical protein